MAEKLLNLRLKYKNKYLDTAKHKRDFKKSFIIGSDKNIFWQILDNSFPRKHKLLHQSKDGFLIDLPKNTKAELYINEKKISDEEAKKSNIIQGNLLKLDKNTHGRILLREDWVIEFSYVEAFQYQPSKEVVALARQFAHWAPLTHEQRFTRWFMLCGLIVTIIGLYFAEKNYVPPPEVDFVERLQQIEDIATRIEPEIQDVQEQPLEEKEQPGTDYVPQKAASEEAAQEAMEEGAQIAAEMVLQEIGVDLDYEGVSNEGEELTAALIETNVITDITVGEASDNGIQTKYQSAQSDIKNLLESNTFDLDKEASEISLEGLTEGINLGDDENFEVLSAEDLGSDLKEFKVIKVTTKAQFEQAKKRFAGLKTMKEGSINLSSLTAAAKTEFANIKQQVDAYKPQIRKIYKVEKMIYDIYGQIEFLIIIGPKGSIESVDYNYSEGSYFTQTFLEKAIKTIKEWKIQVKDPTEYSFRMTFISQ